MCARSGTRKKRTDSFGIMEQERTLGKVGFARDAKREHRSDPWVLRTVFCHNSSLVWSIEDGSKNWASLSAGDQVEFEYGRGERGVEALKVTAVAQFSTRRRGTVAVFHADRGFGFVTDDVPSEVDNKQGALRSPSDPEPCSSRSRLQFSFITTRSRVAVASRF